MLALIFYLFLLCFSLVIELEFGIPLQYLDSLSIIGFLVILILDIVVTVYCLRQRKEVTKITYPIMKVDGLYFLEESEYRYMILYKDTETNKIHPLNCAKEDVKMEQSNDETLTIVEKGSVFPKWMKLFLLRPIWYEYLYVLKIPETIG